MTELFGINFAPVTMPEAVDTVLTWTREINPCRYVVTPNVDYIVLLRDRPDLLAATREAALVLVDGNPVRWASALLGHPLPQTVTGSDLTPALLDAARASGLRVFLLGAAPGVAVRAGENIRKRWPWVKICGTYSPPLGFEKDNTECECIVQMISAAKPQLVVIGLGAPKQELWAQRFHKCIDARVMLCVGATIDFLAGEKARAPLWMRKLCIEWLHRLLTEPRRLAKRYLRDAWIFPQLVVAEMMKRK